MEKPVALITGASRGIGKQLSIDLAAAGYNIVLCARSSADAPSLLVLGEAFEAHQEEVLMQPSGAQLPCPEDIPSGALRCRDRRVRVEVHPLIEDVTE